MTELTPRRLFQTCTWGCGANSGRALNRTSVLISRLLKNKENIEDHVANVLSIG